MQWGSNETFWGHLVGYKYIGSIKYVIFQKKYFRVDGGVSNNDFIVQLISTLTGKRLDRFDNTETSAFGVAFVSGLQNGIWNSKQDVLKLKKVNRSFYPDEVKRPSYLKKYKRWIEACHRFKNWHNQ